jgi:hypothetical protein
MKNPVPKHQAQLKSTPRMMSVREEPFIASPGSFTG